MGTFHINLAIDEEKDRDIYRFFQALPKGVRRGVLKELVREGLRTGLGRRVLEQLFSQALGDKASRSEDAPRLSASMLPPFYRPLATGGEPEESAKKERVFPAGPAGDGLLEDDLIEEAGAPPAKAEERGTSEDDIFLLEDESAEDEFFEDDGDGRQEDPLRPLVI